MASPRGLLSGIPLHALCLNRLSIAASILLLSVVCPFAWADDLKDLYSAAVGGAEPASLSGVSQVGSPEARDWPLRQFLHAEAMHAQGEVERAMAGYRSLVNWAVKDPYGDGLGGSPLTMVALWRWSTLAEDTEIDVATAKSMIDAAYDLGMRRLPRDLFEKPFTGQLPQIQEDVALRLARIADKTGQDALARRLFVDYLSVSTKDEVDDFGEKMMEMLAEEGFSLPRVNLLRGRRLFDLRSFDKAREVLQPLTEADDLQVRVEANFYLAQILWARREWTETKSRKPILDLLSTVVEDASDPDLSEEALFKRGIYANRTGVGREPDIFKQDMHLLIEEFPDGTRLDDALYQLARDAADAGEMEEALGYYGRLQDLDPGHDWESTAFFKPAIALYGRGEGERALEILQKLERKYPEGDLHFSALFWIGRIAHELGKDDVSKSAFERVANEAPFSHYGLRGRMWSNEGAEAAILMLPDAGTREWIASRFAASAANPEITVDSPYAGFLDSAIESGVYAGARAGYDRVRDRFPDRRVAVLALSDLSRAEVLDLSLLVSLRATAGAAFDLAKTAESRLDLAAAVGSVGGDISMQLVLFGEHLDSPSRMAEVQQSERYLATAYPRVHIGLIREAATAFEVQPELLYSVIRRESLFNPRAISSAGAIGLFQFMPRTFRTLDERYQLLEQSGLESPGMQAYLMNPERAISLGARWFGAALVTAKKDKDYLLRIAEHNGGWPAVRDWTKAWEKEGRFGDLEYMIETMGFAETRRFSRGVLTDYSIVHAGAIFGGKAE